MARPARGSPAAQLLPGRWFRSPIGVTDDCPRTPPPNPLGAPRATPGHGPRGPVGSRRPLPRGGFGPRTAELDGEQRPAGPTRLPAPSGRRVPCSSLRPGRRAPPEPDPQGVGCPIPPARRGPPIAQRLADPAGPSPPRGARPWILRGPGRRPRPLGARARTLPPPPEASLARRQTFPPTLRRTALRGHGEAAPGRPRLRDGGAHLRTSPSAPRRGRSRARGAPGGALRRRSPGAVAAPGLGSTGGQEAPPQGRWGRRPGPRGGR